MQVTDRIAALRGEMEREGIDIWIVPSADYHQSEYVGSYFKTRDRKSTRLNSSHHFESRMPSSA